MRQTTYIGHVPHTVDESLTYDFSGVPYIVGNGLQKDHKTVHFLEIFHNSFSVADVRDLDDGVTTGRGYVAPPPLRPGNGLPILLKE